MQKDKIENYVKNRDKFVKKGGRSADFRTAVQNMDEYIADSVVCIIYKNICSKMIENLNLFQKYRSHVFAKPVNSIIKVKTEHDVNMQLGIKTEKGLHVRKSSTENLVQTSAWEQEKKSLIDKIASLKNENQIIMRKFNEKSTDLAALNVTKRTLENRLKVLKFEFTTQLSEVNLKLNNMDEKNKKK